MKKLFGTFLILLTVLAQAQWEACLKPSTSGTFRFHGQNVIDILPGLHLAPNWRHIAFTTIDYSTLSDKSPMHGLIHVNNQTFISDMKASQTAPRTIRLHYRLSAAQEAQLNSYHVAFMFPASCLIGKTYTIDDKPPQPYPVTFSRATKHISDGEITSITLNSTYGPFRFTFPKPTKVLLQDNRNFTDGFELRINHSLTHKPDSFAWHQNDVFDVIIDVTLPADVILTQQKPVTISEGPEWVKINVKNNVIPGSAVDFSTVIPRHAPAGKFGRVIPKGENFEFESRPGVPQRFYGVNLVGGANAPATHEQAIELAERLFRLGYNTVRLHHYANVVYDRKAEHSWELDAKKLDCLDFLFAELKKRGIYMTTDVFSSRAIKAADIFAGETGNLDFWDVKASLPFSEKAMNHWKTFARNFFTHINPYTNTSYAQDPALFAICLVNEGNFGRIAHGGRNRAVVVDLWIKKWNEWLRQRYPDFHQRNQAWGLRDLPETLTSLTPGKSAAATADFHRFTFATEARMYAEMKEFMRNELGCQALLTNMNHSGTEPAYILSRRDFDYVDQHFYIDHPRFLTPVRWALPLAINNDNILKNGLPGGAHIGLTRFFDRPFTVTEFNYSYPGEHRGIGGIMTGCLGAVQNWAGIYRFAYSHGGKNIYTPTRMSHFDLASDPLNQAADRATVCLYLRGDLQPSQTTIALNIPIDYMSKSYQDEMVMNTKACWLRYALIARIGTVTTDVFKQDALNSVLTLPLNKDTLGLPGADLIAQTIIRNHWLPAPNVSDFSDGIKRLQTASRQFDIDFFKGKFTLDTPLTAGGYAPAGQSITATNIAIDVHTHPATVWASSLDGKPLTTSSRLLLTHLTDVQNNGIRFAEPERQTMLGWGSLPLIARVGQATVTLKRTPDAPPLRAFAIATNGERIAEIPITATPSSIILNLDVRAPEGARLMYELF